MISGVDASILLSVSDLERNKQRVNISYIYVMLKFFFFANVKVKFVYKHQLTRHWFISYTLSYTLNETTGIAYGNTLIYARNGKFWTKWINFLFVSISTLGLMFINCYFFDNVRIRKHAAIISFIIKVKSKKPESLDAYLQPTQTSKTESFVTIVKGF